MKDLSCYKALTYNRLTVGFNINVNHMKTPDDTQHPHAVPSKQNNPVSCATYQLLTALAILGLIAAETAAGTDVSGTVPVWSKFNSPYHVKDDVIVPEGTTLRIEPGVDVLFDADAAIIVRGAISAVGSSADSIRFLPGTAGHWKGVRLTGTDSINVLSHVRISGADGRAEKATHKGGGIYLGNNAQLHLRNSVFTENRADSAGGALFVDFRARADIHNTVFAGNDAVHGGAVYVFYNASIQVDSCVFAGNTARKGGGVFLYYSRSTLRDSRFSRNRAAHTGGAFYSYGSTRESFHRCVFNNNTADMGGSAAYLYCGGRAAFTRCLFTGNISGTAGGAVGLIGASIAELTHATLFANTRAATVSHTAQVVFSNSIIWNNGPQPLMNHPEHTGVIQSSYSCIQGGWTGGTNISVNPGFINTAAGDFRLRPDSPCINAGDPHTESDHDGSRADMGALASEYHR